jgi:hypothetical protein
VLPRRCESRIGARLLASAAIDGLGRDDEHLAGGAPVDQSRRRTGVDVAVVAVNSRGSGS